MILLAVLGTSCTADHDSAFLRTDGTRFVDAWGREVLLHGVNVVNKDPRRNYTEVFDSTEMAALGSYGFNVVRLGVIWSGVEPEPGVYNEHYLLEIDEMIRWINQAGMYVLLDMHQDLFGQKFSDGAPDWATLDQGLPHYRGAVWSDAYLISPAVQTAFDNFWNNSHAADGAGVQDRYVQMWKMLAERYRHHTGIVGFDLMNEPFMGTAAQQVLPLMIQAYAHQMTRLEPDWKEGAFEERVAGLAAQWADERGRLEILRTLSDPDLYAPVIRAAEGLCQHFEQNTLNPFYQRLRDSIRQVNAHHILFLEHNYFSNTGLASAIEVPVDEQGNPDPHAAYAAHGYDLVTDTPEVGSPSPARVTWIFNQIQQTAQRLQIPLFIGEWGAYEGDHPVYAETAAAVMALFEQFTCSHAYWGYSDPGFSSKAYFPVLSRSYPAVISGDLISYSWNPARQAFYAGWEVTGLEKKPSFIWLSGAEPFNPQFLSMSPDMSWRLEEHPAGTGMYIIFDPPRIAGLVKISYFDPQTN